MDKAVPGYRAVHFPESSPVNAGRKLLPAKTICIEERLVTANKAIKDRNVFSLKRKLDEDIIVDSEYLDRIPTFSACEPVCEIRMRKVIGNSRFLWGDECGDCSTDAAVEAA